MEEKTSISACILAGGMSSRFGEDKALFPFKGKPLIMHVIEILRLIFDDIAVIGDDSDRYSFTGLSRHRDIVPGSGPLGGIYTALSVMRTERVFVCACDMPYLNRDFISYIIAVSRTHEAAVPVVHGLYEPLHAIYSNACRDRAKRLLDRGERRIAPLFNEVAIREVTEDEIRRFGDPAQIFMNINTRVLIFMKI
mgnify:CR=1 FL=1